VFDENGVNVKYDYILPASFWTMTFQLSVHELLKYSVSAVI